MMNVEWSIFKGFADARALSIQYIDLGTVYEMRLIDGGFILGCSVVKDSTEGTEFETSYKPNGNQQVTPITSDNRHLMAPNRIPAGYTIYPCGYSDSLETKAYGGGEKLILDASNKIRTLRMLEHFYAVGGRAVWEGADIGDEVKASLIAPASTGMTQEAGANFTKVEVAPGSGMHIIVPTPAGAGNWNVNLTQKLFSTQVLANTPVPAAGNNGFFDYNSATNTLTVNAQQKGGYNLYDFPITLFAFLRGGWGRKQDGAESIFESTDVVGKLLFNSWAIKFELVTTKTENIKVGIMLTLGAKKNV